MSSERQKKSRVEITREESEFLKAMRQLPDEARELLHALPGLSLWRLVVVRAVLGCNGSHRSAHVGKPTT